MDKLVKILKNWPNDAHKDNVDYPQKKREKVRGQRGIVYCTTLITVTTKVKAKSKLSWTILTSLTKNKHVFAIIHNSKLTGWTMRINDHNWSLKHHLDTKQENNDMCISAHDNQAPELQDLHSVSTQQRLDTVVLFVKSPCLWALVWSSKLDYQKKLLTKVIVFYEEYEPAVKLHIRKNIGWNSPLRTHLGSPLFFLPVYCFQNDFWFHPQFWVLCQ